MTDKLEEAYKSLLISAGENPEREGKFEVLGGNKKGFRTFENAKTGS